MKEWKNGGGVVVQEDSYAIKCPVISCFSLIFRDVSNVKGMIHQRNIVAGGHGGK